MNETKEVNFSNEAITRIYTIHDMLAAFGAGMDRGVDISLATRLGKDSGPSTFPEWINNFSNQKEG